MGHLRHIDDLRRACYRTAKYHRDIELRPIRVLLVFPEHILESDNIALLVRDLYAHDLLARHRSKYSYVDSSEIEGELIVLACDLGDQCSLMKPDLIHGDCRTLDYIHELDIDIELSKSPDNRIACCSCSIVYLC